MNWHLFLILSWVILMSVVLTIAFSYNSMFSNLYPNQNMAHNNWIWL